MHHLYTDSVHVYVKLDYHDRNASGGITYITDYTLDSPSLFIHNCLGPRLYDPVEVQQTARPLMPMLMLFLVRGLGLVTWNRIQEGCDFV